MPSVVVRYKTHVHDSDENARLIEAVFESLAELVPPGFRYTAYRLDDRVSFVHVADVSGDNPNPLPTLPAFAEFQRELPQRCAEPPTPSGAAVVGSYG